MLQASLMINETEKNLRLAGGAVAFQANHAVDELGALRYVSTGDTTVPYVLPCGHKAPLTSFQSHKMAVALCLHSSFQIRDG